MNGKGLPAPPIPFWPSMMGLPLALSEALPVL